jgi:hypothetical protein
MEQVRINRTALSRLIWADVLASTASVDREVISEPFEYLEINRKRANYNTGSINFTNAWCLYSLTRYFRPKVVAEVGTFIGKSTMAMAEAMQASFIEGAVIHTCDVSNDISLDDRIDIDLVQYPRKTSTEMFLSMKEAGIKADLMFVDGRLAVDDIDLLGDVTHQATVFVFDDFEGIEKGVVNVMNLSTLLSNGYTLVYPPDTALLLDAYLMQPGNLAMILPYSTVRFVNQ